MTAESMVETVARAIVAEFVRQAAEKRDYVFDRGDGEWTLDGMFDIEPLSRAAIAAMREPTYLMINKAMHADGPFPDTVAEFKAVWFAMIDEALR